MSSHEVNGIPRVVLRRSTAKLPVVLGDDMRRAMHEEMLDKRDELSKLETWWEQVKSERKARESAIEDRLADLHRRLRAGHDMMDVVTVAVLVEDAMVHVIRVDTGEVIRVRHATDDELQMDIPGVPASDEGAKEALGAGAEQVDDRMLLTAGSVIDAEWVETAAGPAPIAVDDSTDKIIVALRNDRKFAEAYLEDADREVVVEIWKRLTGMLSAGRTKTSVLAREVLAQLFKKEE